MNLREIKKDIEYVLGAFIEDCSVFATVNPKSSEEEIEALVDEAVALYNDLKDRVNSKEAKGKAYFLAVRIIRFLYYAIQLCKISHTDVYNNAF